MIVDTSRRIVKLVTATRFVHREVNLTWRGGSGKDQL